MKPRLAAFLIHLSISAIALAVLIAVAIFKWYPQPLLSLQGGWSVIALLGFVDLVLGPSLTLLVYRPGKKDLCFDMTVIVIVQVAAFVYGALIVYRERPVFLAFSYSQFFVVRSGDLLSSPAKEVGETNRIGSSDAVVVFVRTPESDRQNGLAILGALVGDPGQALRADRYEVFPHDIAALGREQLPANDVLAALGPAGRCLATMFKQDPTAFAYFRVRGRISEGVAVVNADSWKLVALIDQDLAARSATASDKASWSATVRAVSQRFWPCNPIFGTVHALN